MITLNWKPTRFRTVAATIKAAKAGDSIAIWPKDDGSRERALRAVFKFASKIERVGNLKPISVYIDKITVDGEGPYTTALVAFEGCKMRGKGIKRHDQKLSVGRMFCLEPEKIIGGFYFVHRKNIGKTGRIS